MDFEIRFARLSILILRASGFINLVAVMQRIFPLIWKWFETWDYRVCRDDWAVSLETCEVLKLVWLTPYDIGKLKKSC